MLDLGTVRPGSTVRIPFSSFDKDDGSSITMTNYAAADILVYKDGGTTERASTAGFTATTDFDAKTGKHLAVIDLADNTTAGFWNAGSEYLVALDAVTVDAVTVGGWIARFRIGYQGAWFDTTIATLASQTSFTLTNGPAEDDALNGCRVIIHDIASAVQCGQAIVSDYTGSTKTVTLAAGTTFTAAAGDNISIMEPQPLMPATAGRALVVDAAGLADANTVKVGPSGSGTAQTAGDIIGDTNDLQTKLGTPSDFGSGTSTIAANLQDLADDGTAAYDRATDSLQAIRDRGDAAWTTVAAAAIRAAVGLASANLDTQLAAIDDFLDTEIAAILEDTGTTLDDFVDDLESRLSAALATALQAHALGIGRGVVDVGSTTTAVVIELVNGASPSATNDFYNGRHIVFTSGALTLQATQITDYVGATRTATVTALTGAPADDVTFIIV